MDVAGQSVELGDDQDSLRPLGMSERLGKLGSGRPLTRLDLLVGSDDLVLALPSEVGNTELLSLQAKTTFTLPSCRLLEGPLPLVASIALRGGEFIAEVKKRPDAEIVEVTQGNRDTLPG